MALVSCHHFPVRLESDFSLDLDRMPTDIENEGPPEKLLLKRLTAFMSRGRGMIESSPGFPVVDTVETQPAGEHASPPVQYGIMPLYNEGTKAVIYLPCANCHNYFRPLASIDAFYFPAHGKLTARERGDRCELICSKCGVGNKSTERESMIQNHR